MSGTLDREGAAWKSNVSIVVMIGPPKPGGFCSEIAEPGSCLCDASVVRRGSKPRYVIEFIQ